MKLLRMLSLAGLLVVALAGPERVVSQDRDLRREPASTADAPLPAPEPAEPPVEDRARIDEGVPPAHLGVTFDGSVEDAALVESVAPGSPAEQARLEAGDVIESINGRRVSSFRDVIQLIEGMQPGQLIDIEFSRRISGQTQAVLGTRDGASRDAEEAEIENREPLPMEDREEPSGEQRDERRVERRSREFSRDVPESNREPRRRLRPLLPWRR